MAPKNSNPLIGFVLAVVLTAIPFALVATPVMARMTTLWIIAGAAIVQIVVHLYFFLGIRLKAKDQDRASALFFAFVVLFIMIAGTLWVMANLNARMML